MAELKTKKTEASVDKFLSGLADKTRREDAIKLNEIFKKAIKAEPKMWGPAIVGYGSMLLKYDSGRELDWFPVGFSPRKDSLVLYLHGGPELQDDLLKKLGKYKTGKGCIYIKKLEEVDSKVVAEMIKRSVASARKK